MNETLRAYAEAYVALATWQWIILCVHYLRRSGRDSPALIQAVTMFVLLAMTAAWPATMFAWAALCKRDEGDDDDDER